MTVTVPINTGPGPYAVLLGNFTQKTVTIINPTGSGSGIFVGSGPGTATAGLSAANGISIAVASSFGPIGPLTGTLYATATATPANIFVLVTSP